MVEPITAATSLGLGGGGIYLLLKQWRLRNERLRAKALLEKYGTRTRLQQQSGRMRLIFNNPQVGDLPSSEQEALSLIHISDPRDLSTSRMPSSA